MILNFELKMDLIVRSSVNYPPPHRVDCGLFRLVQQRHPVTENPFDYYCTSRERRISPWMIDAEGRCRLLAGDRVVVPMYVVRTYRRRQPMSLLLAGKLSAVAFVVLLHASFLPSGWVLVGRDSGSPRLV